MCKVMKTLVSVLFVLLFLASGCGPKEVWYKTMDFESFYYGLQETSIAVSGEIVDSLYFVDTDLVTPGQVDSLRLTRCGVFGEEAAECIRVAELGSIGSELLFGQTLVEVDFALRPFPWPMPWPPIGPKWDPGPGELLYYSRFTCVNRSVLRDEIPGYLFPDSVNAQHLVPVFALDPAMDIDPDTLTPNVIIGTRIPPAGYDPTITMITVDRGECNVPFSLMTCPY